MRGLAPHVCTVGVDGQALRLGYALQFNTIPPPLRGLREANLSLQDKIEFLMAEIQDLPSGTGDLGCSTAFSVVPGPKEDKKV